MHRNPTTFATSTSWRSISQRAEGKTQDDVRPSLRSLCDEGCRAHHGDLRDDVRLSWSCVGWRALQTFTGKMSRKSQMSRSSPRVMRLILQEKDGSEGGALSILSRTCGGSYISGLAGGEHRIPRALSLNPRRASTTRLHRRNLCISQHADLITKRALASTLAPATPRPFPRARARSRLHERPRDLFSAFLAGRAVEGACGRRWRASISSYLMTCLPTMLSCFPSSCLVY
ncbi:uncharacterized protein SCHCODRAFT_02277606 [Schizophyllum commune H4-8]|uniref:uncharacterized protein n=1 Tax=Schizophyllum commune (strain H4-8 / FGSC 9210) TaxID=578458 RepID=UPI00215FD2F3|nr:uncharacterized protein SCHCODRAFT_02277606 [Schizophyllum commune H4-8]KAI5891891.1 hypothetical protein SCHCODRAFT_02277606 [Schizophyllum commune H4-8]